MNKNKIISIFILTLFILSSFVSVSAEGIPALSVSLLDYSPQPAQPGQVIDLNLQVSNKGELTKDTSLWIVEEYPFILEQSQDIERAKNLGPVSSTQTLQFRIKIAEDAKDGIVPLTVRYKINKEDAGYIEEKFDINIQTFDARIDILNVRQEPKEIVPGEQGKLIFTITNNDDKPLENIDVVLDLTNSYDVNTNMDNMVAMQSMINARLEDVNRRIASGLSPLKGITPMMSGMNENEGEIRTNFEVIAPVGTSNQKRIDVLKGGESTEVVFDIMPLPNIQPNIYAVPVYMNYNDEDNNPFHVRLDVPVKVNMEPKMFVDLSSTTLRTTDFLGKVEFTVANRGLSDLRYVTIELTDHESFKILTAPRSIYLGDFKPGEAKTGEFEIIAHEDEITMPIIIDYRDSFNKEHTMTKFIPFEIMNRNYYRDLPYEMWLVWIILGGVILLLTIFYVRSLNKKRD